MNQPPPFAQPPALESSAAFAGKLDLCITRTELAVRAGDRAADQSEKNHAILVEIKSTLKTIAADHVSLRHGFPASWPGRAAMIAIGAIVGALTASGVLIACIHHG